MDPTEHPTGGTCSCSCTCHLSLKRKLDQVQNNDVISAGEVLSADVSARVEIENEAVALRETLTSHQQSIHDLYEELEEERSASATAASEAMSMILRLQREKAEVQMEFRQFKRFAEEKMSHDQEEILALEDLLFKRDQAVQSLTCELQAYKRRLMSFGFEPTISEPQTPNTSTALDAAAAAATFDYPPLRCKMPEQDNEDFPATDLDKYAFGETPRDQIQNLEQRICKMERMPSTSHEKGVIAFSPRKPQHSRRVSMESFGDDDSSDRVRVYTVDRVHCVPESCMSTPRELGKNDNGEEFSGNEEEEIKRLNLRLQALEADREAMRQTMMSMGTDKAQLVLLKEIAQQLCKEVKPQAQQKLVKKPSSVRSLSIGTATKLITSFVLWRRKALRTKYTFGITNSNSGLLLLLNKSPRLKQKRSLSKVLR